MTVLLQPMDNGVFDVLLESDVIGTIWCRVDKQWFFYSNQLDPIIPAVASQIDKVLSTLNT